MKIMSKNVLKESRIQIAVSHIFFLVLLFICAFAEKGRPTVRAPFSMIIGLFVIEIIFLFGLIKKAGKGLSVKGACDIMLFVWVLMLLWEVFASVLNKVHPVLVPCPENVFDTVREHFKTLLLNALYSLELLFAGLIIGMALAIILGIICGWNKRLSDFAYPIANVMAPIPAVVFSPYLVAVMPSFRSASALVIVLGVFWPTFLTTVNRIKAVDERILDSAKMLKLSDFQMMTEILLPYIMPGIVSGLKVTLTTSVLMLNFAELMGASHGMGYYIQNAIAYTNYTHAVTGILCIGIVVTILNKAVGVLQYKLHLDVKKL